MGTTGSTYPTTSQHHGGRPFWVHRKRPQTACSLRVLTLMTSPTPRRKVKVLFPLVWSNTLLLDFKRPTYFTCTRFPPCAVPNQFYQRHEGAERDPYFKKSMDMKPLTLRNDQTLPPVCEMHGADACILFDTAILSRHCHP